MPWQNCAETQYWFRANQASLSRLASGKYRTYLPPPWCCQKLLDRRHSTAILESPRSPSDHHCQKCWPGMSPPSALFQPRFLSQLRKSWARPLHCPVPHWVRSRKHSILRAIWLWDLKLSWTIHFLQEELSLGLSLRVGAWRSQGNVGAWTLRWARKVAPISTGMALASRRRLDSLSCRRETHPVPNLRQSGTCTGAPTLVGLVQILTCRIRMQRPLAGKKKSELLVAAWARIMSATCFVGQGLINFDRFLSFSWQSCIAVANVSL